MLGTVFGVFRNAPKINATTGELIRIVNGQINFVIVHPLLLADVRIQRDDTIERSPHLQ